LAQVKVAVPKVYALFPAHSMVALTSKKANKRLIVGITAGETGYDHYRMSIPFR
jgi:hypothetical protein